MTAIVQNLRTSSSTALPTGLAPGQQAFNLANDWLMVGNNTADITVNGAVLAAYGTTATICGVPNVVIPAKPAAGTGYEVFELQNIRKGSTNPTASANNVGELFINTATASSPRLLISNGSAFVPVSVPPQIYSLTDKQIHDAAGSGFTAKANAALAAANPGFVVTDLQSGDQLLVGAGTGGPYVDAPIGSYVWDGTNWAQAGAGIPDATARTGTGAGGTGGTKGVVYLARDSDIQETGSSGATVPDPLAVATAAQVKSVVDMVAGLMIGSTLLGTYDASTSALASVTSAASAGGRTGIVVGAKINAGTGYKEGDFFLISVSGTVAGDDADINGVRHANDHVVWTGTNWQVISGGHSGGFTITAAADVDDDAVRTVTPANQQGLLVRDGSVADGMPAAYKLVDTLDLGTF